MNHDSGKLESTEFLDESFDFKEITWKIPNALTFPDEVDYIEDSPTFSLAGASWKLRLFPFGQTKYKTEGYIDLNIVRLSSRFTEHKVFFKFIFETEDGKEFKSFANCIIFNSPRTVSAGVIRFMKYSALKDVKHNLAPKDTLIIVCQMRIKKVEVLERYSQTETTPSLSRMEMLSDNLKQVFLDGRISDAVLKADGKDFHVHKIILVARSPVFASMFQHDLAEKKTNEVDIPDCTAESFEAFLHYLYTGSVETLSTSNVYNVYYAADKYQVDDLKDVCVKFMMKNISVETFYDVMDLSLRHRESELQKTAVDFFCQNNKEIIKTVKWLRYMENNAVQANELFIKVLKA